MICVLSALSRVIGGAEASAECLVDPGDMFAETEAERKAHSPPPSLVPRLHCIIAHKLTHSNPLLPSELAVPVQREGANLTATHKDTTILSFFLDSLKCVHVHHCREGMLWCVRHLTPSPFPHYIRSV